MGTDRRPFKLAIEGMHCDGCVRRVTAALSSVPGVQLQRVEIGRAEGTLDPVDTDAADLAGIVDGLGFKARPE